MTRTTLEIIGAAALSFALAMGGHWIAYTLVGERGGNNKDFVAISLIQDLLVIPLVSVLIGILMGWFEERNKWWLAGVSMVPLLGYGLSYGSFDGVILILCLIYMSLASSSALLTASLKSCWRRGVLNSG